MQKVLQLCTSSPEEVSVHFRFIVKLHPKARLHEPSVSSIPGLTLPPNAEVVDGLWSGQRITVHVVHFRAIVADARDEGPGNA